MHQVPSTILSQLGGNKFIAMTGAKNFVGSETDLTFSVPAKGINKIRIALDPSDTYTVEAFYIRGVNFTKKASVSDVYCDVLQGVFTKMTGLYTKL
jgi:hypothetical protein